ncbi:MAG: hypothetical protein ACYDEV_08415 [Acidiferrobacter sp.]
MPSPKTLVRQRGFILVTLIFLIIVGLLLMAAMAYLYGAADTEQSFQNSGAQAFIAAESGDQYGVYWLETNYAKPPFLNTGSAGTLVNPPPPADNPDCLPVVTVTRIPKTQQYTVQSVVTCTSTQANWTVVRLVQASKTGRNITYNVLSWAQQ